jgi:O-antigen ligase
MTIAVIIKFIFIFKNNSLVSKVSFSFLIILLIGFISFNVPELEKKINVVLKSTDFDIEIIKTKNKVTVTKNTFEHRLLINYLSIKEVIENSWLGVGTGDYQDFLNEQYREVEFKSGILKKLNNHNQFVAEFLKTGLLGGVIFIILIFNLLNYGVYHYQNYMIVVILFSTACFLESYLDRQHGVMIFAFIIPVFYKYDQLKIEL